MTSKISEEVKTSGAIRTAEPSNAGHKPKPTQSFSRPTENNAAPSSSLMELQDTEHKGYGPKTVKAPREERVLVGFKMPISLNKQQLKIKSAQTGKTMAELLVEGARARLSMDE